MAKRGIYLFILTALLISILSFSLVSAVSVTDCQEIDTAGNYYLQNDITGAYSFNNSACIDIISNDVFLDCQGYIIENSTDGFNTGIRASEVSNLTIKNCKINAEPSFAFVYADGIFILNSTDIAIENITINANGDSGTGDGMINGIRIDNSNNSIISNSNIIQPYSNAIALSNSTYSAISNNYISDAQGVGVFFEEVYDSNITSNTYDAVNWIGIGSGIALYGSSRNIISDNIIENQGSGIYFSTGNSLPYSLPIAQNNTIYNNIFNGSINNIWFDGDTLPLGTINWFNITATAGTNIIGKEGIGGNYYSDYNGTDANLDGFGDTPFDIYDYNMNLEATDYLPLVYPNIAPYFTNLQITPNPAYTNSILNCSVIYNDEDLDSGIAQIRWYNGSTLYSSTTIEGVISGDMISKTVPTGIQRKGENWNCTINITDGIDTNITSIVRTISNSAPIVTFVNYNPNSSIYKTTSQLSCLITATDTDGDTLTNHYLHYKNDVSTAITTQAIINASYSKNDELICQGYADDGSANSNKLNSSAVTVLNSIPLIPSLAGQGNNTITISNSATIQCYGSTDADGDTINYVFYGGTTTNPISILQNSTGTSYLWNTNDGSNYYWRCKAEDNSGGVSSFTEQRIFYEDTKPAITGIAIYPLLANTTDTLNCSATYTDAEGNSGSVSINWYNGSVLYSSNTLTGIANGNLISSALPSGIQARLEIWNCSMNATDSLGKAGNPNSYSTTIINSIPLIPSIVIIPTIVFKNDTLNCSVDYSDTDYSNGNVTILWYNGSNLYNSHQVFDVPSGNSASSSLAQGIQSKNEVWNCTAFAIDIDGDASMPNSTAVIIQNTAPTGIITIKDVTNLENPECSYTPFDIDNDPLEVNITFLIDGIYYGSSVANTNSGENVTAQITPQSAGANVTCLAFAYDGTDTSSESEISIIIQQGLIPQAQSQFMSCPSQDIVCNTITGLGIGTGNLLTSVTNPSVTIIITFVIIMVIAGFLIFFIRRIIPSKNSISLK